MTFTKQNKAQVWSCGGGTQSCAIAALIVQGKLPKPDVAVIADTGRETKTTWHYLENVLKPSMASVGVNIERIKASDLGYSGTELFNASGSILIPVFSTQSGEDSKLPAYCSTYWKRDVVERWLSSEQGITTSIACTWLGYGREEQIRWARVISGNDHKEGRVFLPLVERHPMNRYECERLIASMGWPVPAPRSRCWMCPNQSDREWRSLPPEEFAKAVELEKEVQAKDPHAWLHKSCKPLDQVDFTQPDDLFSRPCNSGNCFV